MLRQNQVMVDLKAICHNYALLRQSLPKAARVMAVVKADAYGHGMVPVARALSELGVVDFAVALVEEGIALREGGVAGQVLVLGAAMECAAEEAVRHELTQTVFTPQMVACLEREALRQGKDALVHIKLDTGMNRIGLRTAQEADELSAALRVAPHVRPMGIYTHFADADRPLPSGEINEYTRMQLERFQALRAHFDASIPAHAANSAMSLLAPEASFSMVREGIALYGYPPVKTALALCPALRWVTEVVYLKELEAGETIGYGRTFTAPRAMRIATVAVGYGDGYHRQLSNCGQMLVCGRRANIVGLVCMDQTMLDVTEIPDVRIGSQVVLLGEQGSECINAEALASWAQTISYEVLLAITARVPKTYLNA
ncbi:MAG: alanine racemase [Clostridia bacterium]